jgi:hypothetical protein
MLVVNMDISTGNSSDRTLARPETFGCHIGTRQDILPDFMYELDKRLASASMFVRFLFFPSRGMLTGNPVIMSIADSLIKFLTSTSDNCITQLRHPLQIRVDLQPYLADADYPIR